MSILQQMLLTLFESWQDLEIFKEELQFKKIIYERKTLDYRLQ